MTETRHKTTVEVGVEAPEVERLQKQIARTFDPKVIDGFNRGIERATAAFTKMGAAAAKAGYTGGSMGGQPGFQGGRGAQGGVAAVGLHNELTDLRKAIQSLADSQKKSHEREERRDRDQQSGGGVGAYGRATAVAGAVGGLASSAITGNFIGQLASTIAAQIPLLGPALSPVLGAAPGQAISLYQEYAQQQMAQAGAFGATGVAGGYRGMGAQYGLQPGAMPGVLSMLAGTSGMEGDRLTGALPTHLALSQLLGVNRASSLVSAGEAGGGRVADPSELMMQAVSEGLAAGIRTTRLDQYLQNVSSWVEGVRSQGIDLAPDSALRMVAGMASAGLQGEAAVATARSLSDALGGAGRGSGLGHGMALRAAGLGQSGVTYQEALERLEQRDPETMGRFVEHARSLGGSTGDRAVWFRRQMEGLGGSLSAVASRQLMENGFDPNLLPQSTGAHVALDERRGAAGGIFGAGATQAGLAEDRMRVGQRVSGTAVDLMRRDTQMIAMVLPAVVAALGEFNERIGRVLGAYGTGGAPAAIEQAVIEAAGAALDVAVGVPSAAGTATQNTLEGVFDAALEPAGVEMERRETWGVNPRTGRRYRTSIPIVVPDTDGAGGPTSDAASHLRRAADMLDRVGRPAESDLASAPA